MGATLRLAGERHAYTLADRATFITHRDRVNVKLLHSGSAGLDNPYSLLVVSPQKHPEARVREAARFADYLTGTTGQRLIAQVGVDRYGEALFAPAQP
jgi:tungstate transport system substrate-binding protein